MNTNLTALGTLLLTLVSGCTQEKEKGSTSINSLNKEWHIRNMSIQLPANWEQLPPLPNGLYPFKNSKCDTTLAFCENLIIHFQPNSGKLSLQQVENSILEALPNRYKQYRFISSQDTIIDDKPGKLIDYMVNEQAIDLGATMGVVIKNDTVVVLTGMALNQPKGNYTKYRRTIVNAITSLSNR